MFAAEAPVMFAAEAPVMFAAEAPVMFAAEAPVMFAAEAPVMFAAEAPVMFAACAGAHAPPAISPTSLVAGEVVVALLPPAALVALLPAVMFCAIADGKPIMESPDRSAAATTIPAIGIATAIALVLFFLLLSSIPLCGFIITSVNDIALNDFAY